MNIWPQRVIFLKPTAQSMEETEEWLASERVQKVREATAAVGVSLSEPVLLAGEDGYMLDLTALGPDAITGGSLLLRVTHELNRSHPVLRLKVDSWPSIGPSDQRSLYPHEVGKKLDALERQLREALGDIVAYAG